MEEITRNSNIKRNENELLTGEIDQDLVMMDTKSGTYLAVNRTGKLIWEKLETTTSPQQLIQELCNRFKIDESLCSSDVFEFLDQLNQNNKLEFL